jgi:hypothetical protein
MRPALSLLHIRLCDVMPEYSVNFRPLVNEQEQR